MSSCGNFCSSVFRLTKKNVFFVTLKRIIFAIIFHQFGAKIENKRRKNIFCTNEFDGKITVCIGTNDVNDRTM